MQLSLNQSQKAALTQQSQQSLTILQMNAVQLDAYLNAQALENPFIEYEGNSPAGVALPVHPSGSRSRPDDADAYLGMLAERHRSQTLPEYLKEQVRGMQTSRAQARVLRYLIGNLDSRGFLNLSTNEIAVQSGISRQEARGLLRRLQSLEPSGVGARSLAECLSIQLRRLPQRNPLAEQIVRRHLPDLAQKNIPKIAAALGSSTEEINVACALIRALNPKPGNGFAAAEDIPYVPPDLLVSLDESGAPCVSMNPQIRSSFRINAEYAALIRAQANENEKAYIREKLLAARWVGRGILRRESTLLLCGKAIAARQSAFFTGADAAPGPYTMRELAESLSLNPSTITRALKDKTLRCEIGTFPLSFFFVRTAAFSAETGVTAAYVKQRIASFIERENPDAPLSDQEIAGLLGKAGISLSRRAVAKYRGDLFLPASFIRKKSP